MKMIGVLGGISAQATMDFEARVHAAAQRLIPPRGPGGYPPLVVYYLRQPPIAMGNDGTPMMPPQPAQQLLEAARWLGTLADFLVVTANGPHRWRAAIEEAAGCPLLSMIDIALDAVREHGWRRVGVLGLGEPQVYLGPLAERGILAETIDGAPRAPLDDAIIRLAEGRAGATERAAAAEAVAELRARAVDGVILGCTEIPLLLGEAADAPDLLNPAPLLVEAAVRHALDGAPTEAAGRRPEAPGWSDSVVR